MIGDKTRADMLGLLLHLLHQPRALDHLGEARIVLDVGRDGELAARLHAADHDRLQHRARRIDRSRTARGTAANDDKLGVSSFRHQETPGRMRCPAPLQERRAGRVVVAIENLSVRASYASYATRNLQPTVKAGLVSPGN